MNYCSTAANVTPMKRVSFFDSQCIFWRYTTAFCENISCGINTKWSARQCTYVSDEMKSFLGCIKCYQNAEHRASLMRQQSRTRRWNTDTNAMTSRQTSLRRWMKDFTRRTENNNYKHNTRYTRLTSRSSSFFSSLIFHSHFHSFFHSLIHSECGSLSLTSRQPIGECQTTLVNHATSGTLHA